MKKTVLVTGGAGFLGSWLCEALVKSGNNVICFDNLLTGSQKNIAHLMTRGNFDFIKADVSSGFDKYRFKKIDRIYHLASPADPNVLSPFSYMAHPFETMKANSVGTWSTCELALKHAARLLYASTSEIYGDPLVSPQDENYRGNTSTVGPRSVYDESKRFGETIMTAHVREKGMDGRIVRIFNTYGPRMNIDEGRAVVNFIKQALSGENMTIYGDGGQTRSFCYVDDQIKGQILAMEKGAAGEVFNIGNPDERTILEFAQMIKKLSGSGSAIVFKKLPPDDPRRRKPDITKARAILGWEPKVTLEDGLGKTIEYFKGLTK